MEPITLDRPFRILAHRGASGYAPENTFASFDLALTMHPDAIETDLRLTRDGVIVLHHDETLDRMTNGKGPLADHTWEEIESLRVAGGNRPVVGATHASPVERRAAATGEACLAPTENADHRIPRLDAFLDRYLGVIPLCLEIKAVPVIAPLVAELTKRNATTLRDWLELTSFEPLAGEALLQAFPELRVGMLVRDFEPATIATVAAAGYQQICPSAKAITVEREQMARGAGLDVRTWGVHDRAQLQHVIACRADGTTLNWPDWVQRTRATRPPALARK